MKLQDTGIAYDDYTSVLENESWHIMYDSDWFTGSILTGIL